MNLYLQSFIPLVVLCIMLIGIIINRKHFLISAIIFTLVVVTITSYTGIKTFELSFDKKIVKKGERTIDETIDLEKLSIALSKQYIISGNIDAGNDILRREETSVIISAQVYHMLGRIAVMNGDVDSARKNYELALRQSKLEDLEEMNTGFLESLNKEYILITELQEEENVVLSNYIRANLSEEVNKLYEEEEQNFEVSDTVSTIGRNEQIQELLTVIQENASVEYELMKTESEAMAKLKKVASRASIIETAYAEFIETLTTQSIDMEEIEKQTRKLDNEMMESPILNKIEDLRITRLKGFLLTGQYEAFALSIDDEASLEEQIIIAELYLAGYVDDNDFSDSYNRLTEDDYKLLVTRSKEILLKDFEDEPRSVINDYKDKIRSLEALEENHVLEIVKNDIIDTNGSNIDSMSSKAFLQLSKIEQSINNSYSADAYMTKALETAYASDDVKYVAPMNSLVEVIKADEDEKFDEIKNIAVYVEEVLDHDMPLRVEEIIEYNKTHNVTEAEEVIETGDKNYQFDQFMNASIVKKTAMISIGRIDTRQYPKITATVQFDNTSNLTENKIKDQLKLIDTGEDIESYTIEKINYDKSRIVLLCDVSGSMKDSVPFLQQAVQNFAADMLEDEEIAVVGFDDTIVFETPFSNDPEVVASYASNITSLGGTNMFSALKDIGRIFEYHDSVNNIVILLTDGQDNQHYDNTYIRQSIRSVAENDGISVYTLGLGYDVNIAYLNMLADAGNGSFLYVNDETSLNTFYQFIHGQTNNQYTVTYEVTNTDPTEREVEIAIPKGLGVGKKAYFLETTKITGDNDMEETENEVEIEDQDSKLVYGLVEKQVFRSNVVQKVELKGTNINENDMITAQLIGHSTLNVTVEYKDSNTLLLTLPKTIQTGQYD